MRRTYSSAWIERLPSKQDVGGSNPPRSVARQQPSGGPWRSENPGSARIFVILLGPANETTIKGMKKKTRIGVVILVVVIALFLCLPLIRLAVMLITQHSMGYSFDERNPAKCVAVVAMNDRNDCYFLVAGNTVNPSLCERITDGGQKDACYSNVASMTRDSSLCEEIVSSSMMRQCYDEIRQG